MRLVTPTKRIHLPRRQRGFWNIRYLGSIGADEPPPVEEGGGYVASLWDLKIIYPMPVGLAGAGLHTNNRLYRQLTGVPYDIRLCAIGGTYYYEWELLEAPSGAEIVPFTMPNGNVAHKVYWANPTGGEHDFSVRVRDRLGNTDTVSWTVLVGTSGHIIMDSSVVSSGTGSAASPYKNLVNLFANQGAGSSIVWFVGGGPDYVQTGIEPDSSGMTQRVDWNYLDGRATIWVAYPGTGRPVLSQGYAGDGQPVPYFRITSQHGYVEGFDVRDIGQFGFHCDRRDLYGMHFRNMDFDAANVGPTSNQGAITTLGGAGSTATRGMCIVDSVFQPGTVYNAIKHYYDYEVLIEGNDLSSGSALIELKENVQFTVRNNRASASVLAIGGDLADNEGNNATRGDLCFNDVTCPATGANQGAIRLGHNRQGGDGPGPIKVYRNTLRGRIVANGMEATHGPHTLENNVICNDAGNETPIPYVTDSGNTFDADRYILIGNLTGTYDDARLAADGELLGEWAEHNYFKGHRIPG